MRHIGVEAEPQHSRKSGLCQGHMQSEKNKGKRIALPQNKTRRSKIRTISVGFKIGCRLKTKSKGTIGSQERNAGNERVQDAAHGIAALSPEIRENSTVSRGALFLRHYGIKRHDVSIGNDFSPLHTTSDSDNAVAPRILVINHGQPRQPIAPVVGIRHVNRDDDPGCGIFFDPPRESAREDP